MMLQSTAVPLQQQLRRSALSSSSSTKNARPARSSALTTRALFGFGKESEAARQKRLEKEEQFRLQQEVLQSRRSGAWKKDVDSRRAKVSKYLRDPAFKKEIDEERRERLKKEAAAEPQRTGFRIIVPVNPIGIPEYETERFDLRLPYVDNGWVDEDADFFKQIGRFFGGGKKKEGGEEEQKGGGKKGRK